MKRALIPIATLITAAAMAAQTAPPAPPQTPSTPTPAPAPKARPRTQIYRATTVSTGGSYLGVDVRDVTPDRVSSLKLKNDQGVEITMVDQDGPAGKAGLKEHDVVVSFNGQSVQSAEQLRRLIRETKPNQSVALGIMRDGQQQTVNVSLADRNKMFGYSGPHRIETPEVHIPPMAIRIPDIEIPSFVMTTASRRNGITVENLTPQLGDYFGVKNGEGVLVRSIEKGSKAEAAGVKAGDVIIRIDNERVSDTRDWARLIRNHDAGTVKLGVMRDRREVTLSMTLPEQKDESSYWYTMPDADQLQMQLQNLGPSMKDQAELQARIAREMAAHQKEIQGAMREAQREIERSMRDYNRDHERAMRDLQREQERQQREKEKLKEKQVEEQ